VKAGTPNHFKTQRLKRLLRIPAYQAIGILEALWQFVAANAWEGDLGKIPDEDVLASIEYDGDGAALFGALVSAKFLDVDKHCRYRIHDWYEHAPEYVRKRIDRKYGKPPSDNGGQWPPTADNGALTMPNQGKPNQDKNSCSEPNKSVREPEEPILEFATKGKPSYWHVTKLQVDRWTELFPGLDILAECRKALAWVEAVPSRRKTARGMPKFLVGWIGRSNDRTRGHPASSASRAPTVDDLSGYSPV
jgi:hypothetical protein